LKVTTPNRTKEAATFGTAQTSVLARLSQELSRIEKRDWELWAIVVATGIALSTGLLVLMFPAAFMTEDSPQLHFTIAVSKELFLGLLTLLLLFNTYLVTKRLELRKTREQLITTTLQSELVRLQSFTDPLTEVYNRRSLNEIANGFISRARRSQKPLTFLLVDADHFKQINTRFGHLTGDMVIAEIATLLKTSVRGSDAVFRYGGDEFLVILSDTDKRGAGTVVDRISKSLTDWNAANHLKQFSLSLSIGCAEWTEGRTVDEVLDLADKNMYQMKMAAIHT
jgi:diguanylate cyclase (GGDEF)-like protein